MTNDGKTVFQCESGDGAELSVGVVDGAVRVSVSVYGDPNEIDLLPEGIDSLVNELNTHKNKLQEQEN